MKKQSGFGMVAILIFLAIVGIIIGGGYYVWQANQNKSVSINPDKSSSEARSFDFSIPELNVSFERKNDIHPLYKIANKNMGDIPYTIIRLSTQELVDKNPSECAFNESGNDPGFSLINVLVYRSEQDLIAVTTAFSGKAPDIKRENGFIKIAGKIFVVPQGIQQGGGFCLNDTIFQDKQWESLHDSLETLRAR